MAQTRDLHLYARHANNLVFERKQVDSADNDISAQSFRCKFRDTDATGYCGQMLRLNQRGVAGARAAAISVPQQTVYRLRVDAVDNAHVGATLGTHSQPFHAPNLRDGRDEVAK